MKNTQVTIKCPICKDILVNVHPQDFKVCKCRNCSLNGDIDGVVNYEKVKPIIIRENKMQVEMELKKATLTHQANNIDKIILVIQPYPAIPGTVVLSIRDEQTESIHDVVVNIKELEEVMKML